MTAKVPSDSSNADEANQVRVWDRFVRIFHWTVVAGFFTAYFTDGDFLDLHIWAGYTVGALVLIRIVWGFAGPRHARFSDFLCGPFRALRYVFDLATGRAARHLGHSPAGGLMVMVLIVGLLGASWTGYQHYISDDHSGGMAWSNFLISSAHAHGEEIHGRPAAEVEFWGQAHGWLADLLLLLAVLHLGGVAMASYAHKENLVRAMVTGRKRRE